ncbi:MAG: glycoside hydrolase family 88 protein [Saprospiraceae bacterium]|nr:glycoside hydrolase family 88 protein [Saprospiraceae bacterium]
MTSIQKILLSVFLFLNTEAIFAQDLPMSERMMQTIMREHKDSIHYAKEGKGKIARWNYEMGVVLNAFENAWLRTGKGVYFEYIQKNMDFYINNDGSIRTYSGEEYNIDLVTPGRQCLTLYSVLGKDKYKKAADLLRGQLKTHPRTKQGGFWHKKIYPHQMWLDGLYMAQPFYAEYSKLFKEDNWTDIVNHFVWMEQNARDPKTGLLYHGWDESKEQKWANKTTGQSPHFWDRAMGWYAVAIVDVLDYMPENHPRRGELTAILNRLAEAVVKIQDTEGCWWQVMERAGDAGNYREASGTAMLSLALAKGVRLGVLPAKYWAAAVKGYEGILRNFVTKNADGSVNLEKTVSVSGLGGNPYRDGSYEYYIKEPIRQNDLKGVGPFINLCLEMERAKDAPVGTGKTVALDYYFNNEYRKGFDGQPERFHYTLDDRMHPGYHVLGNIFNQFGAKMKPIQDAPSVSNLKGASVYIIVDPDTKKETENPHFMDDASVKIIKNWVKKGGTLILLANDTSNCEIPHFNKLATEFGITFTDKCINFVKNDNYPDGTFMLSGNHPIFGDAKKIYVKELSVLNIQKPAESVFTAPSGDVIFAVAKYGKGRVFALGDPWIYNEYLDGRKLPADFDNFKAARGLARWSLTK